LARANTILVDSAQLESDEGMSPEFKKLAAAQIDEFKAEFRTRFPGRDVEALTDEDLMREVLNTVGKSGKLGEGIRCVVSVSMLTEGWGANTVTHILGVRAFGTQLLCEQVVGRRLRRTSYTLNEQGHFELEFAEIYGVPFSFITCPADPSDKEKKPGSPNQAGSRRCRSGLPAGHGWKLPSRGSLAIATNCRRRAWKPASAKNRAWSSPPPTCRREPRTPRLSVNRRS
jgi:hypothetical protein